MKPEGKIGEEVAQNPPRQIILANFWGSAREGTCAESAGSVPNPSTHSARQRRPESLGPCSVGGTAGQKRQRTRILRKGDTARVPHGASGRPISDRFRTDFTPTPPKKQFGARLVSSWSEFGLKVVFGAISDRFQTDLTPISHRSHTNLTPISH